MIVWSEIPPHGFYYTERKYMSEDAHDINNQIEETVIKPKNKSKKTKVEKKTKAKKTKITKVKLTPLTEMSYEDFEKLLEEKGEDEIFEMYADEIREHGEWIWREQDRGGPMYELDSCIRMAEQELIDGLWGPRSE
jgi:hypothetical protein